MKAIAFKSLRSFSIKQFIAFLICFTIIAGSAPAQADKAERGLDPETGKDGPTLEWSSTWTGAFTCKAVNSSTATDVAHITTDNELGLQYTPSSVSATVTYTAATGTKPRVLVGTTDIGNTLTTDNNSYGNSLSWTSTKAIGAVLVGGSSSGSNRLYWMPEGATLGTQFSGNGFQNANGSTITKVSFCYHELAKITIIKEVLTSSLGTASSTSFPFTSANLGANNFSLIDNDVIGPDRKIVTNSYKFAKWNQGPITVTESLNPSWSLLDLNCTETDTVLDQTQYPTTTDFANRKATIKLEEGEHVTCIYKNTQLIPSAAQAEITGRVVDENGTGIRGAVLTLFSTTSLESRIVVTSSFGYYAIENVDVGDYYILTVTHKTYGFPNGQQGFSLNNAMTVNFVGF